MTDQPTNPGRVTTILASALDDLRRQLDQARAELAQWEATYGETALKRATEVITERNQARADLAEATEVITQFAADLGARGIAVPHLFGPRTLATAALEALDDARRERDEANARAIATDEACQRSLTTSAGWRIAAENRAARLAETLREILDLWVTGPTRAIQRGAPTTDDIDRWRAVLADTGTRDEQPAADPAPTGRQCTVLCRDIEHDRDAMTPVVDAARTWRHGGGDPGYDAAQALINAVDAYEATPGIAAATSRPAADDVHLTGPADTPLGRATVAIAAALDGDGGIDAEWLAKIALDAAFPDDGYHQPDYADPSWSAPADHHAEAVALLQDATEPPETRAWTADPTHVLMAAIAHAILATAPPLPADEQGNAELIRRAVAVSPWDVVTDGPETAPNATQPAEQPPAGGTGPAGPAQAI